MNNSDQILTIQEVSKILKISVPNLYAKIERDPTFIPYVRIGRLLRFERDKVLQHFGFTVNHESLNGKEIH